MNKHISLVKKWLNDPASVSQKELRHNADDSLDTARAARAARWGLTDYAFSAAWAAAANDTADASYWIEEYEELSNG
tara:strand:+ start:58 stop:288 length:231 start_codon:yes stop_codon:yes gene_type:complete